MDNVLWTVPFEHIHIFIFIKFKNELSGHNIMVNVLWTVQFERMNYGWRICGSVRCGSYR